MFGYQKRYCFTGQLHLKTALHIGGGEIALGASDHPIVRQPDGRPFIPGSSFKGAFRSTVEKLAATAGVWACGLIENEGCIGTRGKEQKEFDESRRKAMAEGKQFVVPEKSKGKLCYTCQLFGWKDNASKFHVSDLSLVGDDIITQRRDGVAINRDSERAEDGLKFDYEVVPSSLNFDCKLWLENPTEVDLGLVSLGFSEFCSGFAAIGGKRSRGLGNCEFQNLAIYEFDLQGAKEEDRGKILQKYLLGENLENKMTRIQNANKFIADHIEALLAHPNLAKPSPKGEMTHA